MTESVAIELFTLRDGIIALCDPALVNAVQRAERPFAAELLDIANRPHLGGCQAPYQPTRRVNANYLEHEFKVLEAVWRTLMADFRQRIEGEHIYLSGVQVAPDRQEARVAIPGVWVADYEFNFRASAVAGAGRRYVAVRVSARPASPSSPPVAAATTSPATELAVLPRIHEGNIRALTDEEVLLLLEDHARRLVEEGGARLIAPGKISLMPIIKRRMLHRATVGETRETLAAEARELADWIATKVPSHQVPTADTIENVLRNDYRPLKPRSNAMKS